MLYFVDGDLERWRDFFLVRDRLSSTGVCDRDLDREADRFFVSTCLGLGSVAAGIARDMKPPHALCEPLLRSTVVTVGGVFWPALPLFLDSKYFFLSSSTACSSVSTFGCAKEKPINT